MFHPLYEELNIKSVKGKQPGDSQRLLRGLACRGFASCWHPLDAANLGKVSQIQAAAGGDLQAEVHP